MALAPALIINFQITARSRDITMAHLPLHVQQIGPVADRINRISIAELMRCQMAYLSPLAQLPQVLPHSPGGEASPLAPAMGDKQGIEARGNGQLGADLEPAAHVFRRGFVKNNDPILMGLSSSHKRRPVTFLDKNILNSQRSKLTHTQARIQCQRPESQSAHVKPVAFTLVGCGFQIIKEFLEFCAPRSAGQQFGSRGLFGQINRVSRQLTALVKPAQPDFKRLVIAFDTRFFQATSFTIKQKGINRFGGWRPVMRANIGAELIQRGLVKADGLFGLARLGRQEIGNGPIQGAGVVPKGDCEALVRLNKFEGRFGRHKCFTVPLGDRRVYAKLLKGVLSRYVKWAKSFEIV